MKKMVCGAIFAITVIGFTGCAYHLEIVTEKLPGKEHKPNPAMAGIGNESWRSQLYYPNQLQPR